VIIADVKTTWLSVPLRTKLADSSHVLDRVEWVLVEVRTDDGLTGTSYMLTFDYGPELLKGVVDTELKERIVGKDPILIGDVWETCWNQTEYIGQTGVAAWGIAAIEIALWDILGKHLNAPVYKLLGAHRSEVPIYGSGGWVSYSVEQLLEETTSYVKRGFKGVKMKLGKKDPRRDVERVKAVREAIGDDILLMADVNQGWLPHQAIAMGKRLRDFNLFWLEEPVSKDDYPGYARVATSIDIPIASGEREYSLQAFAELMNRNAVSVVQPDVLRLGGIRQCLNLIAIAEAHHLRVASHFYKEIDVHFMASARNGIFLEYFPWLDDLLVRPLQIVDGMARAPETPGLGLEFKPEAIREYKVDG
jgi:L-alanine-DL-glutamate epimerase-like enolase superfamily enzyme